MASSRPHDSGIESFDDFIQSIGCSRSDENHCLYSENARDGSPIVLILYVDDMLPFDQNAEEFADLVRQLPLKFAMKDLGSA